jgi:hypothetical protein
MNSGFNPMRWNCETSGCFNTKRRPKIEVFADCFPSRINFGDVDGLVEYGSFCLLEWKGEGGSLRTGQRISFEQFTRQPGNIVFVVDGNAETMEVTRYSIFWAGSHQTAIDANLDELKERIKAWVRYMDEIRRATA